MNRFKLKQPIVYMIFMLISSFSFSQGKMNKDQLNESWQLLQESQGVKVFAKKQNHAIAPNQLPLEYILLKIENTSEQEMNVQFQLASIYTEGCVGCDFVPETSFKKTLEKGQSIVGSCETSQPGMQVLVNNPNLKKGWDFQLIELKSFNVTPKK